MSLPGVLMGFTFHEFAHAITATWFGDDTPRAQGRVTLSPLAHLDLLGTLLLLIGGFGWARPVEVNVSRLRPRILGDIVVSLAGVIMNYLLACLFFVLAALSSRGMLFGIQNEVLTGTLLQTYWINLILVGFNLLPIPPLDGFRVVRYLIPPQYDRFVYSLYRYGTWILILLFMTGFGERILGPIYGGLEDSVIAIFRPILRAVMR